jgi:putative DNA primase/helicase
MQQTLHKTQCQPRVALIPSFAQKYEGYEEDFREAMHRAGIDFRDRILADGSIHRFPTDKKGDKDGWYVLYGLAGAFGDWRKDIHEKWSISNNNVPGLDKEQIFDQIERTKEVAEKEKHQKYEETAQSALKKWKFFSETGNSPYLERKKVKGFGVRFDKESLIVPLKDSLGKLWSLQCIGANGIKRFLPGGRKKGCFHHMGILENEKPIIIVEGYATGVSIHMATQQTVVVTFDAGNIEPVVDELKKAYPNSPIKIAGDDDVWKETNTGRTTTQQAALKHGCSVVFPTFKNTETKPTDFNDLHVLEGFEEVKRQMANSNHQTTLKAITIKNLLSLEIQPREMILNPIIPEQGLVMIHAPRGVGKTHVSLLVAHAVAMGCQIFNGKWISSRPHKVLFVDGEMPLVVMQERLAKIISSSESEMVTEDNLLIITPDLQDTGLPDLSTLQGQQTIEEHLKDVKLLILDNYSALCRRGRENESESWIPLQEWFLTLRRRGIAVLLIHHSNKNGAQRGTSRKEDILDTVITLRKPENYDPREGARFEVHYEKARGFFGEEAAPFEASLREENGMFTWHVRDIEDCQMDKVLSLKKEGLSQRNIAEETGLSPATINRRLKEAKEKGLLAEPDET